MPTVAATRTIGAPTDAVWEVVADPHHLPRWWPRVARVEGVEERAFTEVLTGKRGKLVRADFDVLEASAQRRVVWSQRVAGTPFEAVLRSAVTAIELEPASGEPASGEVGSGEPVSDDPVSGDPVSGEVASGEAATDERKGGEQTGGGGASGDGRPHAATTVRIELSQVLTGPGGGGRGPLSWRLFGVARFGSPLVRRAAGRTVGEALDGLERVFAGGD